MYVGIVFFKLNRLIKQSPSHLEFKTWNIMMTVVVQYQSYDSNSIDNESIIGCCLPGYLQLSRAEFCFCDSYNRDSLNVNEYMKLMNSIWCNKTLTMMDNSSLAKNHATSSDKKRIKSTSIGSKGSGPGLLFQTTVFHGQQYLKHSNNMIA